MNIFIEPRLRDIQTEIERLVNNLERGYNGEFEDQTVDNLRSEREQVIKIIAEFDAVINALEQTRRDYCNADN